MAITKPVFKNFVLSNSGLYCGLYYRKVLSKTNAVGEQWYWMPTNRSGNITDMRANSLNGYYATDTAALANYPAGYTLLTDNWSSEKYISYMYNYPSENIIEAKNCITDWVNNIGATNVLIPVFYNNIFKSYTQQTDTANFNTYFAELDGLVTHAKNTGAKVSLFVCIDVDDNYVADFWGLDNNEKDEWGYPIRIAYGSGHPSLANTYATGIMKDFFQKVVNRYASLLGNQLNWVTPLLTVHNEYGYNFTNQYYPPGADSPVPQYIALSGYSPSTIAGFRSWLPTQYANVGALNTAWGTSYGNFADVTVPTTGKAPFEASLDDFQNIFASNRGKDWYRYLYKLLYDLAADLRTILASANTTYGTNGKLVLSFGGVSPNDRANINRISWDVAGWSNVSDGLKTWFGADYRDTTKAITLDYLQNYEGKIMTEIHHIDFYDNGTATADQMQANMINYGTTAIQNNCRDVLFIGMQSHGSYYNILQSVATALKPELQRSNDGARVTVGNMGVSLGEILVSGGRIAIDKWVAAGGSNSRRVNLIYANTINATDSSFPATLSLFDNQTYFLKQNDLKNSVYGRLASETGPYSPFQQDYNTYCVPFLIPAFGITYKTTGNKTKSTIEIIDETGTVWVKMVQNFGVSNTEQNGKYANNHPEFRYIANITEDCRFWLPIRPTGGYYDVKISVYDAACLFEVYHADVGAPDRINYNTVVGAGSINTYRINRASMTQPNINQRVIKINCNRYAGTA
ncbi:beta-galactosidase [Emticicia sp. 17c]|uniref:beta-galactosidase n=1 Tax=Emticicia sp. 17c TaxID=3127704 RepID=UPI00301D5F8B